MDVLNKTMTDLSTTLEKIAGSMWSYLFMGLWLITLAGITSTRQAVFLFIVAMMGGIFSNIDGQGKRVNRLVVITAIWLMVAIKMSQYFQPAWGFLSYFIVMIAYTVYRRYSSWSIEAVEVNAVHQTKTGFGVLAMTIGTGALFLSLVNVSFTLEVLVFLAFAVGYGWRSDMYVLVNKDELSSVTSLLLLTYALTGLIIYLKRY